MAVKLTDDQTSAIKQACKVSGLEGDEGALFDAYEPSYEEGGHCFAIATFGRNGERLYSRFLVELTKSDTDLAAELADVVGAEGSGLGEMYWFFLGYQI